MGRLVGLNANVGGSICDALLLLLCSYSETVKKNICNEGLCSDSGSGRIHIPVVIAMSASQDVVKAVRSGWLAILCGITLTVPALPYTFSSAGYPLQKIKPKKGVGTDGTYRHP